MTRYWVVALIAAVVAVLLLARRSVRRSLPSAEERALVPHGDGERELVEFDPIPGVQTFITDDVDRGEPDEDDTTPAVLSPPEWTPPRSVSNGRPR